MVIRRRLTENPRLPVSAEDRALAAKYDGAGQAAEQIGDKDPALREAFENVAFGEPDLQGRSRPGQDPAVEADFSTTGWRPASPPCAPGLQGHHRHPELGRADGGRERRPFPRLLRPGAPARHRPPRTGPTGGLLLSDDGGAGCLCAGQPGVCFHGRATGGGGGGHRGGLRGQRWQPRAGGRGRLAAFVGGATAGSPGPPSAATPPPAKC